MEVGGSAVIPPNPWPPTGLSADATSITDVHLHWTQSTAAATSYTICRNAGSGYFAIGIAPGTASTFDDSTLTAGNSYLYEVRTVRNGLDPARAALQLRAIGYDDPTITSGVTVINANHITQLRTGVQYQHLNCIRSEGRL